jgi:hypothetical protein
MTEQELTALAAKWAAYPPFDQTGATRNAPRKRVGERTVTGRTGAQDCREIAVGYLALLAERKALQTGAKVRCTCTVEQHEFDCRSRVWSGRSA